MSDLPEIKNGHSKDKMPYHIEAETHFQRRIRRGSTVLLDHITKVSHMLDLRDRDSLPEEDQEGLHRTS
jgi:hypothetical protein